MKQRLLVLPIVFFALTVLIISFYSASRIHYSFSPSPVPNSSELANKMPAEIDYKLPVAGSINPQSPIWPIKAMSDKIRISFAAKSLDKANISLSLADHRLSHAKELFERGEIDSGVLTLMKAENYLKQALAFENQARKDGENTEGLILNLYNSSIAHKHTIENLAVLCPDDARSFVHKIMNYPNLVYEQTYPLVASQSLLVNSRDLRDN